MNEVEKPSYKNTIDVRECKKRYLHINDFMHAVAFVGYPYGLWYSDEIFTYHNDEVRGMIIDATEYVKFDLADNDL